MEINDRLDKYSGETVVILSEYMENTAKKHDVKLSIEDVFGLCSFRPEFEKLLGKYLIHNNQFCNFVKHDKACLWKCCYNKALTIEKCKMYKKPFFGTCYMGISEYVFPVILNKKLVSVIYTGQFCHSDYNLKKLSDTIKRYKLPESEIKSHYSIAVKKTILSDELILDINVIKKLIYLLVQEAYEDSEHNKIPHHSNSLINNAISFINENYTEPLSLSLIASSCYCNPSYLSYIMKKNYGMNVIDYIRMVRLNKAKELIGISSLSLTEIAYKVGFNDLAYFSRIFKKSVGMTPNEYRKTATASLD